MLTNEHGKTVRKQTKNNRKILRIRKPPLDTLVKINQARNINKC